MASVNKAILVGNLTKDPEQRFMTNGDAVCNFSMATNESWTDKGTGEKKEAVEFHRIVVYRKLGEVAAQYLKKGSQVYLEGKIKTKKWQDKDGQDRYTTEIEASSFQMLGAKGPKSEEEPSKPQRNSQAAPPVGDLEDDIPFAQIGRGRAYNVI